MTVQYMEVLLKISNTLPFSILEKVMMALGEVDLGIGPERFPPIIQVIMVDHLVLYLW